MKTEVKTATMVAHDGRRVVWREWGAETVALTFHELDGCEHTQLMPECEALDWCCRNVDMETVA